MVRKVAFIVLIIVSLQMGCVDLQAQKSIEMFSEYDDKLNATKIFTRNNTASPMIVKVIMKSLKNYTSNVPLPYEKTVYPGTAPIITLKKINTRQSGDYRYSFTYIMGALDAKPDSNFIYLLPALPGKTVSSFPLTFLGNDYGDALNPKGWYALGIKMEPSDTVCAIRAGTVVDIDMEEPNPPSVQGKTKWFDRNRTSITIYHSNDRTFAKYEILNEILINLGDKVLAGQPIATAAGDDYQSGSHIRLSVSYSEKSPKYSDPERQDELHYWAYLPIYFHTKSGVHKLEPRVQYESEHPVDLITKEMRRREKRKYLSGKH